MIAKTIEVSLKPKKQLQKFSNKKHSRIILEQKPGNFKCKKDRKERAPLISISVNFFLFEL